MDEPKAGHPTDAFHQGTDDLGKDRKVLDDIFRAGARARLDGTPSCDNPYAAGSEERQEWSAGWCATVEPEDQDHEPNSGYEKN